MSGIDIVLLLAIALAVALAIRSMVVNKRRGKSCSGCCEQCGGCERKI